LHAFQFLSQIPFVGSTVELACASSCVASVRPRRFHSGWQKCVQNLACFCTQFAEHRKEPNNTKRHRKDPPIFIKKDQGSPFRTGSCNPHHIKSSDEMSPSTGINRLAHPMGTGQVDIQSPGSRSRSSCLLWLPFGYLLDALKVHLLSKKR
jgi:hypothetical protein